MSMNKNKLANSIQKRGQYSTIPNEIWHLPLDAKSKIVYCYLICQSESWKPGQRTISKAVGFSQASVGSALKELQAAGMLVVRECDPGMRNLYELTGLDEWTIEPENLSDQPLIARSPINHRSGDQPLIGTDQPLITSKKNLKKKEREERAENFCEPNEEQENPLARSDSDFPDPAETNENPAPASVMVSPPVSVSPQPQTSPAKQSVTSILRLQAVSGDFYARAEEMRQCIHEMEKAGNSKDEVVNHYQKIFDLWMPSTKVKLKDREGVEKLVRRDLNNAIAEFYPAPALPPKQKASKSSSSTPPTTEIPASQYLSDDGTPVWIDNRGMEAWKATGKPRFKSDAEFIVWAEKCNIKPW